MPHKLLIILNPTAGKGAAAGKIEEIKNRLDTESVDYNLVFTERPGHASEIAAAAIEAFDSEESIPIVVAAGGDGTANEVVNGLLRNHAPGKAGKPAKPLFSVLPIGRGNDMAWGLGIATDWREALGNLQNDETRLMDTGFVKGGNYPEGLYFGNGLGVGFDAIVGFEAARMKRFHGAASYTIGALKTIITYPDAPLMELTIDGETRQIRPALVSVMNGQRMGGSFFMAPDASVSDGRFNWCHTHQGRRLTLLSALAAYGKGQHRERKDTEAGMASRVSIRALEGNLAVHADGETVCEKGKELEIEIVPGALRLIGSIRH